VLKEKKDIQLNEVDLIENNLIDDPYHPDYIKVEEEMDLWDDVLEEAN
jgi:hypothetical protein